MMALRNAKCENGIDDTSNMIVHTEVHHNNNGILNYGKILWQVILSKIMLHFENVYKCAQNNVNNFKFSLVIILFYFVRLFIY